MSEDLISRKSLIGTERLLMTDIVKNNEVARYILEQVLYDIEHTPIAFDKEKVIEELKSAIGDIHYTEDGSFNGKCIEDFEFIQAKTALEIVEKGGIE